MAHTLCLPLLPDDEVVPPHLICPDQQPHCNGSFSGWGSAAGGGRALVEDEACEAGQSGSCVPELASALPMTAETLVVKMENPKGRYKAAPGLRGN